MSEQNSDFESQLVSLMSKNLGYSEGESSAFISAMKQKNKLGELKDYIQTLSQAQPFLSGLDPASRSVAAASLAHAYIGSNGNGHSSTSSSNAELAERLALIKAALARDSNTKNEELDAVRKELEQVKEENRKKELEEYKSTLLDRMQQLEGRIIAATTTPNAESDARRLLNEAHKLEEIRSSLRGLVGVAPGGTNLADAKATLESAGYRVQGPLTHEDVEKLVQLRLSEIEAKMKAEQQKHDPEKALGMATELMGAVGNVLTTFLPETHGAVGKLSAALNAARKGAKAVNMMQQQQPPALPETSATSDAPAWND